MKEDKMCEASGMWQSGKRGQVHIDFGRETAHLIGK